MKVDNDFECKNGILLVILAENFEHGGHEGVGVGFKDLLLRQTMCRLEDNMAKTLLWGLCREAARCRFEQRDKCWNDVFQEEGIVEVLEEIEQFFEIECNCELCLGI